ncbi:acetyltransferase [Owenweeksia hongkongensis]|uniref:acetyltransferase n=1 Tax=Owenweeksia hongkongensis TaxID=253245 RepID=UPI003A92F3BF
MAQRVIIIGAGGLGREVAATIQYYLADSFSLQGFVDDGLPHGEYVNDLKVLGGIDWLINSDEDFYVVLAVASPKVKKLIHERLKEKSFTYPNIIHPFARLHSPDFIEMGEGNIISDGCIITTNVFIGNFNLINLSCTVGHDATIADYCSIMPSVNISGGARLQNEVYVGTGAKLIKATTLYTGCVVGAGAVVNTDIPSYKSFAGVPAKELQS